MANSPFPTPAENIVLDLLYEWLGERRCNRTTDEYLEIAQRVPKALSIHSYVNQRLGELADTRQNPLAARRSSLPFPPLWPYQICRFKSGDRRIVFEEFPTSVSLETVRKALKKSGLRTPRTGEGRIERPLQRALAMQGRPGRSQNPLTKLTC